MMLKTMACFAALALMASLLVSVAGCCPNVVRGSGNLETREMDFSGFTELEVSHAFQIDVARADSYGVAVTADDNLWEYLEVWQTGQILHIGVKDRYVFIGAHVGAVITMPDLRGLTLAGASRGDVSGFSSAEPLSVNLSGASSIHLDGVIAGDTVLVVSGASRVSGELEIGDGQFDVSGASTIELEGSADNVFIAVSGASSAKLEGFPSNDVAIELSGASRATINADGMIDADVSGVSNLVYLGDATLGTVNISGASKVEKK